MRHQSRLLSFFIALLIVLVDFLSKRHVLANQERFQEGIDVIPGIIQFNYVRNAGAAFGMFQGQRWPFVASSAIAVIFLSWLLAKGSSKGIARWSYVLILGGAFGNLIDRLFYGGLVVDFIETTFIQFPIFNVADIAVSCGAVLLGLSMLQAEEKAPEIPVANDAD